MSILFNDFYPLAEEDDICVRMSNRVLFNICKQLGYTFENFAVKMEDEFGYHIAPDDYVDFIGLAIFIDDIGLDSNTFFDDFVVVDFQIIDYEGNKAIGVTLV